MSIATEFPDYDLSTLPPIPADWVDHSWHNDSAPSWLTPTGFNIWIDYEQVADREHPAGARFIVHRLGPDGDFASDEAALETDDWAEVLRMVAAPDPAG
jgi:hypothetical protein